MTRFDLTCAALSRLSIAEALIVALAAASILIGGVK